MGLERRRRRQGAVERQPAHSADQAEEFGDVIAGFGWWKAACL
jgi:hypothetical protein